MVTDDVATVGRGPSHFPRSSCPSGTARSPHGGRGRDGAGRPPGNKGVCAAPGPPAQAEGEPLCPRTLRELLRPGPRGGVCTKLPERAHSALDGPTADRRQGRACGLAARYRASRPAAHGRRGRKDSVPRPSRGGRESAQDVPQSSPLPGPALLGTLGCHTPNLGHRPALPGPLVPLRLSSGSGT